MTLLAIWLYLRHLRLDRPSSGVAAGLGLAAVFFYKYNYGVFLIAAVLLDRLLRRPFRFFDSSSRGLWIPVPLALIWFAIPGKLSAFLDFAGNRDSRLGWLESLVYYPRALIDYYAAWWPSGVLTLAGAAAAVAWRARQEVRFLLLFALVGLAGMTLHHYKLERSIVTVAPALWILCGVSCSALWRRLARGSTAARVGLAAALAIVLLSGLPRLYARDLPAIGRHVEDGAPHPWSRFPWPGRDLLPVRELILNGVNPKLPVLVAGEFDELPPTEIQMWFGLRYPRLTVVSQCFRLETPPRPPLNLVTIEVMPQSHYFSDDYRDYNAWALEPIHQLERSAARPAIDTTLARAGVRVRVYRFVRSG